MFGFLNNVHIPRNAKGLKAEARDQCVLNKASNTHGEFQRSSRSQRMAKISFQTMNGCPR